jgi:hypothetical protein
MEFKYFCISIPNIFGSRNGRNTKILMDFTFELLT